MEKYQVMVYKIILFRIFMMFIVSIYFMPVCGQNRLSPLRQKYNNLYTNLSTALFKNIKSDVAYITFDGSKAYGFCYNDSLRLFYYAEGDIETFVPIAKFKNYIVKKKSLDLDTKLIRRIYLYASASASYSYQGVEKGNMYFFQNEDEVSYCFEPKNKTVCYYFRNVSNGICDAIKQDNISGHDSISLYADSLVGKFFDLNKKDVNDALFYTLISPDYYEWDDGSYNKKSTILYCIGGILLISICGIGGFIFIKK